MAANENRVVYCALKGNAKVVNIDNSKLARLPPAITRLTSLHTLSAKNNFMTQVDCLQSLNLVSSSEYNTVIINSDLLL